MLKVKKVKVLGVTYTIHQLPLQEIARILNAEGAVGFCDDLEERIVIASELKGKALKKILLHEVFHAISGASGLNQTLGSVEAEVISQSFANAMIELLEQKEFREHLLKP